MNGMEREELLRDVRAAAWAARRRRRRNLRALAAGGCSVAALAMCAVGFIRPERNFSPAVVESHAGKVEVEPAPPTQREKDDALLDSLAEAGPIIVTLPDGSRQLFLTKR